MRLVATQAKTTKKYLNNARDIILDAIKKNNFNNTQAQIEQELNNIPIEAMKLIKSLAEYEAEYSYKKMKNLPGVKSLNEIQIDNVVNNLLVKTSLNAPKRPIDVVYREFAQVKGRQLLQMISDSQLNYEGLEAKIVEATNGLFNTQNNSLAKLAIVGTANAIRNRIIINANIS